MRTLVGILLAGTVAALAGCSSSGTQPGEPGDDGKQISELVERMNDDGGRNREMKQLFAVDSAAGKEESKKYQQYRYDVKDKPNVSGTSATAKVAIEKHSGGEPVEKEWQFVKEGDKWKIKSAPLP